MISRYEVREIAQLWTDEVKFQKYLKVEIAHLRTLASAGFLASETVDKLAKAKIDPTRILEIEKVTNHDVIAFCSSITEQFIPEEGRLFHFGITSSDIIDTAHALLVKESMAIIEKDLITLNQSLLHKAQVTSDLLCIGRSHGISAEAMIFGQKFLSFSAELERRLRDWKELQAALTGKMSGAVGNYTVVSPEFEDQTLAFLELKVEPVSSQVIPRDHYAKIVSTGALLASLFERMATEFRLLQHSDIDEVKEGFSKGQKGSSTMPHKKNPISSENITGIARLLRSHITPMLENCILWHERDISHSSVERVILPDHFGLLAYCARRMKNVVENLVIEREKIEAKVKSNEKIYSSWVLHQLILANPKIKREQLYEVVQMAFFHSNSKEELVKNLTHHLNVGQYQHHISDWLSWDKLHEHYRSQFHKLLTRS